MFPKVSLFLSLFWGFQPNYVMSEYFLWRSKATQPTKRFMDKTCHDENWGISLGGGYLGYSAVLGASRDVYNPIPCSEKTLELKARIRHCATHVTAYHPFLSATWLLTYLDTGTWNNAGNPSASECNHDPRLLLIFIFLSRMLLWIIYLNYCWSSSPCMRTL